MTTEPDRPALRIGTRRQRRDVFVVTVTGRSMSAPCQELSDALAECLAAGPAVVILDLSGVSCLDPGAADLVTEIRSHASRSKIPVELVISSYAVAKPLQITAPDAVVAAWPSLQHALATVDGSGAAWPAAHQSNLT